MFSNDPNKTPFDLYAAITFAVYAASLGPVGWWLIFAAALPVVLVEWRREHRCAVKVHAMLVAMADRTMPITADAVHDGRHDHTSHRTRQPLRRATANTRPAQDPIRVADTGPSRDRHSRRHAGLRDRNGDRGRRQR